MASSLPHRRGTSRRSFLADMGMGVTGLALGSLLQRDGVVRAAPPSPPLARGERVGRRPMDGRIFRPRPRP